MKTTLGGHTAHITGYWQGDGRFSGHVKGLDGVTFSCTWDSNGRTGRSVPDYDIEGGLKQSDVVNKRKLCTN